MIWVAIEVAFASFVNVVLFAAAYGKLVERVHGLGIQVDELKTEVRTLREKVYSI